MNSDKSLIYRAGWYAKLQKTPTQFLAPAFLGVREIVPNPKAGWPSHHLEAERAGRCSGRPVKVSRGLEESCH